ncbi:MAG: hypothetical protein NXI22_00665 [bacterium]|nr:hypothetical protein [bacterium]
MAGLNTILLATLLSLTVAVALAEEKTTTAKNPSGIVVPSPWPPQRKGRLDDQPMKPPYLTKRPAVIPIDIGRQLLVDDFLIDETTLVRTFHQPKYHPTCPVVRPDKEWELGRLNHSAVVYSDGVWYDPADKLFKMWYLAVNEFSTCMATSEDGIRWKKPSFDVVEGTNIVYQGSRDASTIWLDLYTDDAKARYKMFRAHWDRPYKIATHLSPDGIHWSEPVFKSGPSWDRTSVFYNPFRKVWVYSVRGHDKTHEEVFRQRLYHEGATVEEAANWKMSSDDIATGRGTAGEPVLWVAADHLDPKNPDPRFKDIPPQLYNLDVTPYENLLVGMFTIWQGPDNESCKKLGIHKRNEVLVGFSRDGFHWDRPSREQFLPVGERATDWNGGNVQSAGGGFLVVGDKLYFYCSGRAMRDGVHVKSTGLATLRRDGFASLDAKDRPGEMTTQPLRFTGKHLFVNVQSEAGELRAEMLDRDGKAIPGCGLADCLPLAKDSTRVEVRWRDQSDLASLAGQPIRIRFSLTNGSLYAFWVSQDASGASNGMMAAGGPGISGPRDTSPVKE